MSLLLYNCSVVTPCNGELKVIKNAYVGIEGEQIKYVGDTLPKEEYDTKKNMHFGIIMPGLYNCHTHSPMVLLRGVGSDLPLDEWLFGKICPIEDKLTAEDIKAGSFLAIMEMLACGTVSFSDMYFEPQVTAAAAGEVGIKANISRPVQCFSDDELPKDSYRIKQSVDLFNSFNGSYNSRILVDFCVHAEYTCKEKIVRAYSEICCEHSGNMHIHLSETYKEHNACIEKYKMTPAQWFYSLGAFNSRAFAAHCVALSDSDIELLKNNNVSIVHNPTSNMKLGSGFAPIQKFLDNDINVTIGTDGAASNNNLNMFEEMHLAAVIHNGYLNDATIMKPSSIISMATQNGARLQGRKNCGVIKEGYKADLICVGTDAAHMQPCLDIPALLVYSAQASDVKMTMCDGKILYENGEYKTIDTEKVLFDFNKTISRLYK